MNRDKVFGIGIIGGLIALALIAFGVTRVIAAGGWTDANRNIVNLRAANLTVGDGIGTGLSAVFAGSVSFATGDTTKSLSATGVAATDLVVATINTGNSSGRTIKTAAAGTDSVLVTLSGTPGATTQVSIAVLRPAS